MTTHDDDFEQAVAGFETEVEFQHWLAKAWHRPYVVDLIFGTGHGQPQIDDEVIVLRRGR